MAVTIKERLSGQSVNQTVQGYTATRIWTVDGLSEKSYKNLAAAIDEISIPAIGEAHPDIPSIVVTSKDATPEGFDKATVTVTYSRSVFGGGGNDPTGTTENPILSVSSRLEQVDTERVTGLDGTPDGAIKTFYVPGGEGSIDGRDATHTPQVGKVKAFVPRATISFQRQESVSAATVVADAAEFVGFTNSGPWLNTRLAALNEADVWLCIGASANSTDGGLTFVRNFEFAYNPETWNVMAVFIDEKTGRPPEDVTLPSGTDAGLRGNGTLMVRVAGQRNFADLNLSLRQ